MTPDQTYILAVWDAAEGFDPERSTEYLLAFVADLAEVDYMDVVDALAARARLDPISQK